MSQDNSKQSFSVSVVIPAYNAEQCIGRSIDSVLGQTLPADEIIVVDDGSTDNTAEIIKQYGSKVRYIYQGNSSCAGGRNTGIRVAKCEWIALQDADDEWLANKLELQMKLLEENPDLRWCGSNNYNVDGPLRTHKCAPDEARKGLSGRDYFESYLSEASKNYFRVASITMIIHRDVFAEVGLFAEDLLRSEDTDMWCRIAFCYPKFGYIAEPLAIVHMDVSNPALEELRLYAKRGVYFRKMVSQHLPLAEKSGCLEEYKAFARQVLKRTLKKILFHGHKQDARETVTVFKDLFAWYWRFSTYICLGLESEVTRRWARSKTTAAKINSE
jgi:glycosyltransferase involved in cell wall biosynthesis